jgi:hypothetical protein
MARTDAVDRGFDTVVDGFVVGLGEKRRQAGAFAKAVLDARHGAENEAELDDHPHQHDEDRQGEGHFDDRRAALVAPKLPEDSHHSVLMPATATM